MPVQFLTSEQRANYGRYVGDPTIDQLTRYFYLDDADHAVIGIKRGDHNRLGFALQLTTARFLGTFLEDPTDVPGSVLQTLVRQLQVTNLDQLLRYRNADQRWEHTAEIRSRYGFSGLGQPHCRLSPKQVALCVVLDWHRTVGCPV